ncbi:MAG: BrnT family toxin [Candidatus Binatia bacterium]
MDYEWDPAKAEANFRKHDVDFADAVTALEDELAITILDPDAEGEGRFITVGMDAQARLLVTIFTLRDERIRIISSRKATRGERRRYEEG